MKTTHTRSLTAAALICAVAFTTTIARAADPLPSSNGKAKQSIIDFVAKVTPSGSPYFVPIAERVATFDNDGTLWCEQPEPVQLYFALDRVKALAPQHPEWKGKEPFASLLKGDLKTAFAGNPGNGDIGSTKVRARRLPSLLALRDANELDQPTHRHQPAFPISHLIFCGSAGAIGFNSSS